MADDILKRFNKADKTITPRLVMASHGIQKQGKTRFGLTMPGPIGILNLDIGLEGVVGQFTDKKDIYYENYVIDRETDVSDYKAIWDKLENDFYTFSQHPEIKSIIFDTMSEARELALYSLYGRAVKIMPHDYGPANNMLKSFVKYAMFKSQKNFLFIHQMKDEYIANEYTGQQIRKGIKEVGYSVQVNVEFEREIVPDPETGKKKPGDFVMRVIDCRQNATIAGNEYRNELVDFKYLAADVYPETNPEDWE